MAIAGLFLSALLAKETVHHAEFETKLHHPVPSEGAAHSNDFPKPERPSLREIFALASWKDRDLLSCSQAGLVNNLNDGMSWGIYPLFFASFGLSVAAIGTIKAVYPTAWGILQVFTGPLSDRWGRKRLIAGGMLVQAGGIWLTVQVPAYPAWMLGALLQGIGTAMVYPTLLAAISDVAHPEWRATTMGVYRFLARSGICDRSFDFGHHRGPSRNAGGDSGGSDADADFGPPGRNQDARDACGAKGEGGCERNESSVSRVTVGSAPAIGVKGNRRARWGESLLSSTTF